MTMRSSGAAGYGLATANGIETGAFWPWAVIGLLSVALLLAAVTWVRQRRILACAEVELERLLAGNFQQSSGTASDSNLPRLLERLRCHLGAKQRSDEQSEQLLHMLIDEAPMAILLLEDAGEIEYANESARGLFFE